MKDVISELNRKTGLSLTFENCFFVSTYDKTNLDRRVTNSTPVQNIPLICNNCKNNICAECKKCRFETSCCQILKRSLSWSLFLWCQPNTKNSFKDEENNHQLLFRKIRNYLLDDLINECEEVKDTVLFILFTDQQSAKERTNCFEELLGNLRKVKKEFNAIAHPTRDV